MTTVETMDERVNERTYANYARPLWWRVVMTREFAVIALVVAAFLYSNSNVPNFSGPLTLYYLFLDLTPVLLMAMPMTLVIITGEIDLSVASVLGLSSVLLGILHVDVGLSIPVAGVITLMVGLLAGALNGFLVAYVGLPSLAVTVGTLALYRGIAVGLLGTEAKTDFPEKWTDLAKARIVEGGSYPQVVILIAVLAVLFLVLLHFTTFGRGVYEIGLNEEAARFSGVSVERTKLILFMLTGVLSALAGIYFTLRYGSARGDNGEYLELQVIAAVLLGGVSIFGGRGKLIGVLAGVLLIGVLQSAFRLELISTNITNITIGLLLIVSVIAPSVLSWAQQVGSGRARRRAQALDVTPSHDQ